MYLWFQVHFAFKQVVKIVTIKKQISTACSLLKPNTTIPLRSNLSVPKPNQTLHQKWLSDTHYCLKYNNNNNNNRML